MRSPAFCSANELRRDHGIIIVLFGGNKPAGCRPLVEDKTLLPAVPALQARTFNGRRSA
jgi:hypothetical protein